MSYLPRPPTKTSISSKGIFQTAAWLGKEIPQHHRTLTSTWFSCSRPHCVILWLDGSIIIPLCRSSRIGSRSDLAVYASLCYEIIARKIISLHFRAKRPGLVRHCEIINLAAAYRGRFQPLSAAQGNVSEILLFNFQRTQGG